MKAKMIASILALTMLSAVMCMAADDNDEKRQKTRKMAAEALQDLYKLEPTSQAAIQKGAGYAVFDKMGVNVLLFSTARGSGLAVNNKTKQITLAFSANSQVKTETKVEEGLASQTVKIETAEVVYVSGNDLVVKTDDGELRHFPNVSDDKTVTVAGKELTVHDLKPGMKLQRTTITSTTPRMITTVKTVTGKVWRVSPPNSVILTLEDGTNQSFSIPKGQKFNVDGQEIDAWGIKEGMNISATAVTETPETVVSQEVVRTGIAPPPKPDPPRQDATLLILVVPAK
jgi:hypothetical protein